MGKVGDRLKELKSYFGLMQRAGKIRLLFLLLEVFLLLIIFGLLLEIVTMWYILFAVLGSTCYVIFIIIRTLNRFR